MQVLARASKDNGVATIDPWTVVHFGSGLAIGLSGLSIPQTLAAITLSGIAKRLVSEDLNIQEESAANKIVDIFAIAAGFYVGRSWQDNR